MVSVILDIYLFKTMGSSLKSKHILEVKDISVQVKSSIIGLTDMKIAVLAVVQGDHHFFYFTSGGNTKLDTRLAHQLLC